jgi:hypothetical protein
MVERRNTPAGPMRKGKWNFKRDYVPKWNLGTRGKPGVYAGAIGDTRCFVLNEINFRSGRRLNPDCFGILTWGDRHDNTFAICDDPWQETVSRENYRDF